MSEIFRFPKGGYEVTVCRKKDIIDSIEDDSVDKEVLDALIEQCERDAEAFLQEGRWTGIPYIGNMRVPAHKQKFKEINGKELVATARETMKPEQYAVFKRELNANIAADVAHERLYKYQTSMFVKKHRWQYNKYLKDKRASKCSDKDAFARFMCYSCINLTPFVSEE